MKRKIHLRPYQELNGGLRLFLDAQNRPQLSLKAGDTELSIELSVGHLQDLAYFTAQCVRYAMETDAPRPDPVRISGFVAEDQA